MKKDMTKPEAQKYLETAAMNFYNMIPLTLSPSEERDLLLQKFREMCELVKPALDRSSYFEIVE